MTLQTEGAISLNDINIEAGNSSGSTCSLNDAAIRDLIDKAANATSSFEDFYGASSTITFTYEIIGAGGAGGYGRSDGSGSGTAPSGGASSLSGSGFNTVTSQGGAGGQNSVLGPSTIAGRDGEASHYGAGGAGGGNNGGGGNAHLDGKDAPTTSYGAGGGGGGSDSSGFLDAAGYAGEGGSAATRLTGSITVEADTTITITIGVGGTGPTGEQGRNGGDGANGYAKITVDGTATTFTSSGTLVIQ